MLLQKWINPLGFRLLQVSVLSYIFANVSVQAQIIPDQTLPENSIVTPEGNLIQIEGGTTAGNNLFHSFEQFSVPANVTASFNNSLEIQNIFSRVTGGSISQIEGTIKALGAANLFLINPNGIIFGEKASLDVGGSFFATTAESIMFAGGSEFSAQNPDTAPLLTVNIPIGLWFRENPANIVNHSGTTVTIGIEYRNPGDDETSIQQIPGIIGGLGVQPGQTLGLIGGNVIIDEGNLTAENGRIELGSVGENSFVRLDLVDNSFELGYQNAFELNYQNTFNFKDVQIINGSQINTQGEGGGNVQIQGRQVTLSNRSEINSSTLGNQPGGSIEITATESIDIITSQIQSEAGDNYLPEAAGNGGDILLNTERLSLSAGGLISVSTFGIGDGGNLIIQARDVEIVGRDLTNSKSGGQQSGLFADVFREGTGNPDDRNGGNIFIITEQLSVRAEQVLNRKIANPPEISASLRGTGNAGNININASNSIEVINSAIRADIGRAKDDIGTGGDLIIQTGNFLISEGSFISATTLGQGNAGNIEITATDIEISNPSGLQRGGILAQVNLQATGDAGDVFINTERLTLRDGEFISVASENIGNAGNLEINATEVELIGESSPATRSVNLEPSELQVGLLLKGENEEVPNRIGGNLILNTEQLTIRDGARISSLTVGNGNGGNVNITATEIDLYNGGGITARADQDSMGGNISINTDALTLRGSNISANAQEGQGGNININTEEIFQGPYSQISATSALGIDGTVTLNTPIFNPTSGLIEVPQTPIDVTSLIGQDACSSTQNSEFINTGRGGLPPSPQDSLQHEQIFVGLMDLNFEDNSNVSTTATSDLNQQQIQVDLSNQFTSNSEIVPARGWIRDANGDVILVGYDPTQTGIQRQRYLISQCQSSL
ncbi:MAG: filamentous hemagglutinin N-terminal domain-containing protein [Microcoleaceae cyanobacterium]